MAISTRMAFFCKDNRVYFKYYTFNYYSGFAISQKRKTIQSFHETIKKEETINVLEVSRKNENELGAFLSAFNLLITIDNKKYPVECIYQASKVFGDVQYKQCMYMEPAEAKRYVKENVEKNNLFLTKFSFKNLNFPLEPKSIFYDYLYIYALYQNKNLSSRIIRYDCFTDIEFNHKKQFASQARSCALFKYLFINNKIEQFLLDPLQFKNLYLDLQETRLF